MQVSSAIEDNHDNDDVEHDDDDVKHNKDDDGMKIFDLQGSYLVARRAQIKL